MVAKSVYVLFAFLLFCGIYPVSFAQQIQSGLRELSDGADVIVTGKVIEQTSSWNEDNTRIYTRATIEVQEHLKGNNPGSSLTVRYLGGEVGEIGEMYSHMPRFINNEEVLVFLKKDRNDLDYKVYDGENGKISIIEDPQTGEKITNSNVRINSLKAQINSYIND